MGPEKTFEKKVRSWLEARGAWVLKTISEGRQEAGVPDLLICYKGQFVALELKSETGAVRPLQEYKIKQINDAGGLAMIVRPSDWPNVQAILEDM